MRRRISLVSLVLFVVCALLTISSCNSKESNTLVNKSSEVKITDTEEKTPMPNPSPDAIPSLSVTPIVLKEEAISEEEELNFYDTQTIDSEDWTLTVKTKDGQIRLKRMGSSKAEYVSKTAKNISQIALVSRESAKYPDIYYIDVGHYTEKDDLPTLNRLYKEAGEWKRKVITNADSFTLSVDESKLCLFAAERPYDRVRFRTFENNRWSGPVRVLRDFNLILNGSNIEYKGKPYMSYCDQSDSLFVLHEDKYWKYDDLGEEVQTSKLFKDDGLLYLAYLKSEGLFVRKLNGEEWSQPVKLIGHNGKIPFLEEIYNFYLEEDDSGSINIFAVSSDSEIIHISLRDNKYAIYRTESGWGCYIREVSSMASNLLYLKDGTLMKAPLASPTEDLGNIEIN